MADPQQIEVPEDFGNEWMSNLEEIGVPEPVPFTPQTAGWYLLAGLLAIGAMCLAWRFFKKWRLNAYRREALHELAEIEGLLAGVGSQGKALQSLPELVKRVALVAYPRTRVAELSGEAWLGFLDGAVGSTDFTRGPGRLLPELAYDPRAAETISQAESRDLISLVGAWIRHHRTIHEAKGHLKRPAPLPAGVGDPQASRPLSP
jgi:hypothetical protein